MPIVDQILIHWFKMTRVLQNRLALANVKVKHGWENLSLDSIEPKVEEQLKRKRPGSSSDVLSDSSSSKSDRFFNHRNIDSSPLTAPLFSDDVVNSGSTNGISKRMRYQQQVTRPVSSSHNRTKVRTARTKSASWKSSYHLPQSSPSYHNRRSSYSNNGVPAISFASETSTIPNDDPSQLDSESDDNDLPTLSFQINAPIQSSPPHIPRTPSPDYAKSARVRSKPFDAAARQNEGADLLMYLAASPSPAKPRHAPSTPPPKSTPLPSSMMHTPGGTGAAFLGLNTPGTSSFNFADYLNVTPSPAQIGWKTPGAPAMARTPLAAKEARRRLNFDSSLVPPSPGHTEGKGLGMDLGGELVSSQ
jgi:hypothetical protein